MNKKLIRHVGIWCCSHWIFDFVWCDSYKFSYAEFMNIRNRRVAPSDEYRVQSVEYKTQMLMAKDYRLKTDSGRWQSGQLHQTVNLTPHGYVGSNPTLPKFKLGTKAPNSILPIYGPLAHLARAVRLFTGQAKVQTA